MKIQQNDYPIVILAKFHINPCKSESLRNIDAAAFFISKTEKYSLIKIPTLC